MTSGVRGRTGRRATVPDSPPARPDRRQFLRRRLIALAVLAGVLGLVALVLFTPLAGVRSVEVTGVTTIDAADVRAVAAVEPGTPLLRLDTEGVHARVARMPKVFAVRVSRSFPSTVVIEVTERSPVAVVSGSDGTHLVDRTGMDYDVVRTAPPGLPKLTVGSARPDDPATTAALAVLEAIPHQLQAQVVEVTAKTPGNVQLILGDGRLVKWGGADESERKAAVLGALLTREGKVYDVATPSFPTVS
ncbi:cell division protein FtsQ/DivIB [Actinophytocola sp.]|uniref:cell division protein FtsQ/DivIB n=1 Tax=Actinophytocola sp. TaxID=1872138 RepID=UPI002D7E9A12|nr:FtsQ-type POTRA domain-containing protein [Actinophytocola sp.]HET9142894.1 FtsQ-type POTRA domain-containing protein [Actinophytocola sp.]